MISNCIITGCARSGTSMMAGMLRKSYYMGDDNYPARDANPKGFFEGPYLNDTNNIILNASRGVCADWWVMPLSLETLIVCPEQAAERIRILVGRKPFCYKDPRFCYSLPAWRPYLKDTKFICTFRHPASSIKSLMIENSRSAESCIKIQTDMYMHVLQKQRHEGEWLFFHYNQLFSSEAVVRIRGFLGVEPDAEFPELKYMRPVPGDIHVPPHYADIYYELCSLAGYGGE